MNLYTKYSLLDLRYRNVLTEILKNPEAEMVETLKAFVEASKYFVLNSKIANKHFKWLKDLIQSLRN